MNLQHNPRHHLAPKPNKIKDLEYRTYATPDGYVNAIRQLTKQGYNYFLPVAKTRRRSAMYIGKVAMPRTTTTVH